MVSARAPRQPGSRWRDFYVWSDTPDKYQDARIIFKDFEPSNWTWDPVAKAYYWHRFFSHQPDLNFDNPDVHEAMLQGAGFLARPGRGRPAARRRAVSVRTRRHQLRKPCRKRTPSLKQLRKHVDEKYGDRMLLAEANQWPEDAVAYFGQAGATNATWRSIFR